MKTPQGVKQQYINGHSHSYNPDAWRGKSKIARHEMLGFISNIKTTLSEVEGLN